MAFSQSLCSASSNSVACIRNKNILMGVTVLQNKVRVGGTVEKMSAF